MSVVYIDRTIDCTMDNFKSEKVTGYEHGVKVFRFKPLNGNITYNGIQAKAASIYKQGAPTINSNAGEIALINSTEFLTGNQNTNRIGVNAERTLDIIANAKANSEGLTKASQTKDSESNGLSNYTPSRLLGSILSQMSLQCKQPNSATRHTSLVTNPDLLKGFLLRNPFPMNWHLLTPSLHLQ